MFRVLKNTVLILSLFVFTTCINDNYDKSYTTFEEDTIISFLANNEIFSEFYKLVQAEGLTDLLNAYGTYTCFAPTNEAMRKFYEENKTSFESLSDEMRKELVNNCLLTRMYQSKDFPEGALTTLNFDSRYLYIHTTSGENQAMIYVNRDSRIILLDQDVHNGVVHAVDAVLTVNKTSLPEVIAQTPGYTLFSEALIVTGIIDSFPVILIDYHQEKVVPTYYADGAIDQKEWNTPPSWKYGYTALVESDSVYAVNNIHNLDELKAYAAKIYDLMYPADRNISDVTDRRNSLNRFVAYHILDRELTANEFVHPTMVSWDVPGTVFTSQMTTFLPNSLLEVRTGTLFNKRKDGFAVRIISPDNAAVNGVFHGIDNILTFDEGVINDVFNTRIRFNTIDFFPELATNKMRGVPELFFLPPGFLKNITHSALSSMVYFASSNNSLQYQDEVKLRGKNDFTITLPPIPPGTYEFRLGYLANSNRGVCQMYFDGKPCGIPLNMNIAATNSKIGWVADNQTEDDGIENDKMMHNRGYMKGPNSCFEGSRTTTLRTNSSSMRKIVTTVTFEKMETHTFRAKSVEESFTREFQMDYFEFVPLWYLAVEGKD